MRRSSNPFVPFYVSRMDEEQALAPDRGTAVRHLLSDDDPLQCIDIGARAGVPAALHRYQGPFRFYLCDPEPAEAARLRRRRLRGDRPYPL